VVVDLTADDTSAALETALLHGMDLVLANKRPIAGRRAASEALWQTARARGRRILHEATVGAGLPIIDTYHKLTESGDRVERIEGLLSGTLGYVLSEVGDGTPFSRAVRSAMRLGYTEPDPRDDLSGVDVGRKALILARLLGYRGELGRASVESLVPKWARALPLPEFLERLTELDDLFGTRQPSRSPVTRDKKRPDGCSRQPPGLAKKGRKAELHPLDLEVVVDPNDSVDGPRDVGGHALLLGIVDLAGERDHAVRRVDLDVRQGRELHVRRELRLDGGLDGGVVDLPSGRRARLAARHVRRENDERGNSCD
jgi:hypothetical protein